MTNDLMIIENIKNDLILYYIEESNTNLETFLKPKIKYIFQKQESFLNIRSYKSKDYVFNLIRIINSLINDKLIPERYKLKIINVTRECLIMTRFYSYYYHFKKLQKTNNNIILPYVSIEAVIFPKGLLSLMEQKGFYNHIFKDLNYYYSKTGITFDQSVNELYKKTLISLHYNKETNEV